MNLKTVLIRALSVAALLLAMPAALPAAALPSERVLVSDLDLATPLGQQQLKQRVHAAVHRVCAGPVTLTTLATQQQVWRCRSAALADVRQQLRNAGLPADLRQASRD